MSSFSIIEHDPPFLGSKLRQVVNERYPTGTTASMEQLSKEADAAFKQKHGWAPGEKERLYEGIEHEGSRLLKHRPIPEVYKDYGIRMKLSPLDREVSNLKTWMKDTASQPSSAAVSLAGTPILGPTPGSSISPRRNAASWRSEVDQKAGVLIMSNLNHKEAVPLVKHGDTKEQGERLLEMQEDLALVHEEFGYEPRSQHHSAAGSRVSSLAHSLSNSPALGPSHREILNAVPIILTPAQEAVMQLREMEASGEPMPYGASPSTVLSTMTDRETVYEHEDIGDFSPRKSRPWERDDHLTTANELRYSPFMFQ